MVGLFSRLGLSISRLRGQGYGGAYNERGELDGLKTLVLKENPDAYYVHCFAYRLQSSLVAATTSKIDIRLPHSSVRSLNWRMLLAAPHANSKTVLGRNKLQIVEALDVGDHSTGLKCSGSHYDALINLIGMFSDVIDVLEMISEDVFYSEQEAAASILLNLMLSFEFVFNLHPMKTILGITNVLSDCTYES
ncbi:uncharacterized protein LOC130778681 [Actinidia eriantha]|uniref:uncharacterized protein LOC130778681 n=1 Tax=Actinidia eriantha TaxID=165200 RepID=UPI002584BB95|nr:uncharacterized protein LOC130778681 [Actinidia eriantha]